MTKFNIKKPFVLQKGRRAHIGASGILSPEHLKMWIQDAALEEQRRKKGGSAATGQGEI